MVGKSLKSSFIFEVNEIFLFRKMSTCIANTVLFLDHYLCSITINFSWMMTCPERGEQYWKHSNIFCSLNTYKNNTQICPSKNIFTTTPHSIWKKISLSYFLPLFYFVIFLKLTKRVKKIHKTCVKAISKVAGKPLRFFTLYATFSCILNKQKNDLMF